MIFRPADLARIGHQPVYIRRIACSSFCLVIPWGAKLTATRIRKISR